MKITIDTQTRSSKDLKELKEFLENNSWDFETDEDKVDDQKYMLLGFNKIHVVGSHGVELNERIADEEMHEYRIVCREDLIEDLMRWIGEGNKDKELMKQDLKMLMQIKDEYIFSSISTNSYICKDDAEFNETCKELIELNESLG